MDLSKLSQNQQITVGAAAAMFLFAFFPWYGVAGTSVRWIGWNAGLLGVLGILAIVAAGVILILEALDQAPVSSPAEIVFYLAVSGAALILLRFIFRVGGVNSSRRFWLFLAIVAAGSAAWGAYQNRLDNS